MMFALFLDWVSGSARLAEKARDINQNSDTKLHSLLTNINEPERPLRMRDITPQSVALEKRFPTFF